MTSVEPDTVTDLILTGELSNSTAKSVFVKAASNNG